MRFLNINSPALRPLAAEHWVGVAVAPSMTGMVVQGA